MNNDPTLELLYNKFKDADRLDCLRLGKKHKRQFFQLLIEQGYIKEKFHLLKISIIIIALVQRKEFISKTLYNRYHWMESY